MSKDKNEQAIAVTAEVIATEFADALGELEMDFAAASLQPESLSAIDVQELEDYERRAAGLVKQQNLSSLLDAASTWKEAEHRRVAAKSAKKARENYAAVKDAATGEKVRPYKHHDHAPPAWLQGETFEGYSARLHRDRQRSYNGVTAETVQPRQPATPERRAEQLRAAQATQRAKTSTEAQSAARKERRRAAALKAAVEPGETK